ncbi:hypothetical protein NJT12_04580 [Flavobacterium sp. AC]|uniref:Uncharacterized protein n=1 Tax=Flavobacterium azizsancarii TaxID=2961580 RepID=A0ABT4W8T1_9FLAO|nr:hypothetical protein [Flavobacterium azizsancarii]MDA6068891.1 hypothetical protein [Flavobacterium azizsancarii]
MIEKFLSLLLLILCSQVKSQNATAQSREIEDNSISYQLFTKCFDNLNQGSEILEKYPALKDAKLCSLLYCMHLLAYPEKDIQFAAENRLIGIATQLYNENTPAILIMGLDSSRTAKERNKNLEDDNNIVYISYGECTNPAFLREGADIVNKQTMQLINKNSLR